jgi:organic hydroperoxide reductase OsmC/OhrA
MHLCRFARVGEGKMRSRSAQQDQWLESSTLLPAERIAMNPCRASRARNAVQAAHKKLDMTHEYHATVEWHRQGVAFVDGRYSRGHVWRFDGGVDVPASSAPSNVPLPYSVGAAVDPEEALVAAASSCHMLFFLSFAAKQGLVIHRYSDEAIGSMTRNDSDKLYLSKIVLNPDVTFYVGTSERVLDAIHHRAHEECYIANSVKAEIIVRTKRLRQA